MLINVLDDTADMAFNFTESPWLRWGRQYAVRDLWTHTDNGVSVRTYTAGAVPAHGAVALLLTDAGEEPKDAGLAPCALYEYWGNPWCVDQNGTKIQPPE